MVAFGLWTVLAVVVVLNSAGSFTVDTKPELYYAPWRSAAAYLSAWQADPQLGFPSFNVGLAPVAAAVGLIQAVGFPPALSVRVLRLALLVLGSWGAARLYRAVRRDGDATVGPLVAGTVFVANPYLVVAGATQPILLPWALLPWQLLCLVRALHSAGAGERGWRAWRWPAGFGLAFAAMSGTNAGVVPLLQLLAVPVVVLAVRAPWPAALAATARCAALVAAVSAYWVLPSVLALGAGATVVDNSETPAAVAAPSSAAEVLRGLGLWTLYGSGGRGQWLPEFVAYLDSPVVVVASFALPVLAALALLVTRGAARRLGIGLVLLAVPVMVGLYPPARPSPFGRVLGRVFDAVPFAGAFRTTNKIGSLLVLGIALLVAAGTTWVWRRWPGEWTRAATALGLAVLLAAGTVPAWTGNLYIGAVDLPGYWRQAAADLDADRPDQRVWFVPGQVQASYRWTEDRPDDLATSVLDRPSLVRTVIPATSPAAANLLAAVDTQLQEGTLPPGALSTAARYLGVGDVLLRNDVVWEVSSGARPAAMQAQVGADPGLVPRGTYGAPGQNTISPTVPPSSAFEAALPPLQRYSVTGARAVTRVDPAAATVLVDGDGWALPPLSAAGLLPGAPAFRYLADLDPAELARLLPEVGRLVLTDSNRRRETVPGRLGGSQGPLLPAATEPVGTRALGGVEAQTVLEVTGGSVRASDVGSAFGPVSAGAAENAVDGDPRTAWQFGDFSRAVGQSLEVTFSSPRAVPAVSVRVRRGAVQISKVRLQVGGRSVELAVDRSGLASWTPASPVRAGSVRLTVLETTGDGFGLVGVEELGIPGVRLTRVAQLPRTLERLAARLDPAGKAALSRKPVDVVLGRQRGTALTDDDEETGLARDLTLPVARDYRAYAVVRPSRQLPEKDIDTLAGATPTVTATSTSRAFGLPTLRASQALDGKRDTGWLPGEPTVGQAMEIAAPRRRVDHVDVTQAGGGSDWITRVRLELDGEPVAEAGVGPGTRRIRFAAQTAERLRLTVLGTRSGRRAAEVRVSEVDFGGARIRPSAARAADACVPVATVDGRPLLMRPVQGVTTAGPELWAGCGPVRLQAGDHSVRPVPGWQPDELVLRDPLGDGRRAAVTPPGPRYSVHHGRGPRATVRVSGAVGAWYLMSGQAYDPRWRAEVDGVDLGPPVLVDGYATGWRVDVPGTEHAARIWYGPQRVTDAGLVLSGTAVLGCLVLLLLRAPPRPLARLRARPTAAAPPGSQVPTWVDGPGWTVPDDDPAVWSRPDRDLEPGSSWHPSWFADAPEPPPADPTAAGDAAAGDSTAASDAATSDPAGRPEPMPGEGEPGARAGMGRWPEAGAWAGAIALAWLLGGLLLAGAAAAVAGWHATRRPGPRTVIAAGAALLAAVPVAWLALRPHLSVLTFRIVADNPWPHRIAALGLLLIAVGVLRAERTDPDPEEARE
jgi:arabinofuranan 3-O-arabinosyltransferase